MVILIDLFLLGSLLTTVVLHLKYREKTRDSLIIYATRLKEQEKKRLELEEQSRKRVYSATGVVSGTGTLSNEGNETINSLMEDIRTLRAEKDEELRLRMEAERKVEVLKERINGIQEQVNEFKQFDNSEILDEIKDHIREISSKLEDHIHQTKQDFIEAKQQPENTASVQKGDEKTTLVEEKEKPKSDQNIDTSDFATFEDNIISGEEEAKYDLDENNPTHKQHIEHEKGEEEIESFMNSSPKQDANNDELYLGNIKKHKEEISHELNNIESTKEEQKNNYKSHESEMESPFESEEKNVSKKIEDRHEEEVINPYSHKKNTFPYTNTDEENTTETEELEIKKGFNTDEEEDYIIKNKPTKKTNVEEKSKENGVGFEKGDESLNEDKFFDEKNNTENSAEEEKKSLDDEEGEGGEGSGDTDFSGGDGENSDFSGNKESNVGEKSEKTIDDEEIQRMVDEALNENEKKLKEHETKNIGEEEIEEENTSEQEEAEKPEENSEEVAIENKTENVEQTPKKKFNIKERIERLKKSVQGE